MKVSLFITCFNDTLFPRVGRATVQLLERLGHTVEFLEEQTCCGQMHFNTGYQREALPLIRRSGASKFEPQCWKRHRDENNGRLPLDWPHTLRALYKVRCNLFHGEKALTSKNDQRIVYTAFHTLLYFLHSAHYIEGN